MATIVVNTPDNIQFVNSVPGAKTEDRPTLIAQSGDWEIGDHVEAGIVFDLFGAQPPLLTPIDARKLAKWLTRAADNLDGVKHSDKKHKHRHHYEDDDDDNDLSKY